VDASDQPTEANFRLRNVEEVEDWLGQMIETAKGLTP
jgi:hypothetical protein